MTSLDSGLGRDTSTPRVDIVNSGQEARRRLMSRAKQSSLSTPLSEIEMSESDLNISTSSQILDLEQLLQDLTKVYERCKRELE